MAIIIKYCNSVFSNPVDLRSHFKLHTNKPDGNTVTTQVLTIPDADRGDGPEASETSALAVRSADH